MLRKVAGVIGMVLSVLFFLGFLAGIAGAWVVRGQVLQLGSDVAAIGTQSLQRGLTATTRVSTQIDQTQSRLTDGVARVQAAGDKADSSLIVMDALLNSDLGPSIERLKELATNLRDTVATADQVISLLQRLPFSGSDNRLLASADAIVTRIQQFDQRLQAAKAALASAKSQAINNTVQALTAQLTNVSSDLQDLQNSVQQLTDRMTQAQARIPVLLDQFNRLVTGGILALTLVFFWMALSQVAVFLYAYRVFTGRDLFARRQATSEAVGYVPQ